MRLRLLSLAAVPLAALLACGGYEESSSCSSGSAVQVTASSASPSCLAVAPGATVSFTNTSQDAVTIRSAPHPVHGSCPELDALATLAAGASISVPMGSTAKACGYHREETGAALGEVRVGNPPGGGAREY
jgi:hypothetical protein